MRQEIYSLTKGIDEKSFPYQLFQKAKQFGTWNPRDIDFTQDKEDWKKLTADEKESMRLRISRFLVGEESVTSDILPIIMTVAKKGWIEDEMYLTTFLFEEAKHVDFFHTFLSEMGEKGDLAYSNEDHKKFWFDLLPNVMDRLLTDPSPQNMAEASGLYNMFLEGVQAETSYYMMYEGVKKLNKMPGLLEGIGKLKTDESRHISYGTYFLQRLIREDPHLYDFVEDKMRNEWWPLAEKVWPANAVDGKETDGFGVPLKDILEFAKKQLNIRLKVLKKTSETQQMT